ncbi:MAG: ATP-binding protein [Bacteroidales bacterium]
MACAVCEGTGWKAVTEDGVRRMMRCDCWREEIVRRRLTEARIPKRYEHCDLSNFVCYENDKLARAINGVRRFTQAFPVVDKGLFLIGPPGIGKSHLAVAALKHAIVSCGARGLFYDVRELLKLIRSTYNQQTKTAEMEVLRPVLEADLLVLDDLGAEKTSEWVEETLNLVVNTRYSERRPTIFTSNYEEKEHTGAGDSLLERVGFRTHSRLYEMCDFLEFDGCDYRSPDRPPNAGPDDLLKLWQVQRMKGKLPHRPRTQARAQLRGDGKADLKWPGGRAGSH